ncbi:MAG TPA: amidohydrolase family protein [Armatimonadota bacterium]|nr:amidohydrolase family protein [Armatimonadota bacterium]HOS44042.1 amidohydrolase family protein [Armatimonadota bacterium]
MTIALFDVQCGFGGAAPGSREPLSAAALLAEMDGAGVERALARAVPAALEIDISWSNRHLFAACAGHPRLVPCPIVAPNSARDLAPEHLQLSEVISQGAGAVSIRPRQDTWSLAPWCCDRLFTAMQTRRLPVLCQLGELSYDDVAALAERYPTLPLVIIGADYRSQRILLPLLEAFATIYLSIGSNYIVQGGIEQCVETVGARRLLFGTGFPEVDMPAHIAQLMYADIADDEKRLIGAGNLDRLLQGVQR